MEETGSSYRDTIVPKLQKITLAFDGSANSFEACEAAGIIAKGYGAEVTVVYALPPISIFSTPLREKYYAKLEDNASVSIGKAASLLTANDGVKVRSNTLHSRGSISETLIRYVTEERSDLVVVGTRGLGGFDRMILGSVSRHLAGHCPSPVMVVRKNQQPEKKLVFKRILVATDGSEIASRAERMATSLAKALGGELTFVNVVYLPPGSYSTDNATVIDELQKDLREDGEKVTARAASFAKENKIKVDTKIMDELQSPVMALTKLAEVENYDLIALGSRGLGGFKELVLGSVASGVVHYAHCSVLVAK
jgi:nucleotide-binding universal stress UspA family protein